MRNPTLTYKDIATSLYVPSINKSLMQIVNMEKFEDLKSIIICLEDSILDNQVEEGERNLKNLLANLTEKRVSIFVRPRNFKQFKRLLKFDNIEKIDGFVIAKFGIDNMDNYTLYFKESFYFMPVLETIDIFEVAKLSQIRDFLMQYQSSILSVRIGSEDIGKMLRIKRGCGSTIYDIPIFSTIITNIIAIFKPYKFNVTAPVFSCYKNFKLLQDEVSMDIQNGLFGKSLIHPSQIKIVTEVLKVTKTELVEAKSTLKIQNSAVIGLDGKMIEKIPHKEWAEEIIMRGSVYGVK